ncbi:MAG: 3-oxoacyl-ACP reductase FabG [Thaumarchaeota archaeon]|nr:3-oxoacyl-ACP reductase FabG [Nitrososphaerota archaeon]MCL5316697.1 3-oxoacyl-ACP reductase FabG [Nitrososphaerota archaeon]
MNLKGKVAIVTGSSRGIGRFTALELARAGADVVINYLRSGEEAENVAGEVRAAGSKALVVKADVSVRGEVEAMVSRTVQEFGAVHILVNNAGFASGNVWETPFEDITDEMWRGPMEVDLKGTFLCLQAVAPAMKQQKEGKIVNVASTPALAGDLHGFVYAVAKAGVLGMTKALAWSLAPYVQVNAVALGSILTDWVDWLSDEELQAFVSETALKRFGKPEEVARVIAFLASSGSDYMSGQTLIVDGGTVMR